ncbi:bifunctional DNA-formamidopyrimidine glycosylase/DNA-(apurinic or apyrimidinic site) lyase [Sediminicurvatus halobius]|uniref:Formamidopyrimidine-DNA glycosylase n=1 Tax=Sediminicurvatus halobius TaxID=2182432 RepID=A0A2U2N7E0_9GAMM|nr:bifunctional DNA-formamidopyrimidine glycosylase/DNA-(apurinic or apyrimidinic site) lyase [Spiribacter halobius]PWG64884.1 DNA-formamidopyrimidine glycosylase [Spiribacter halobius]UEX78261.1 bifunctional DNA-formamidopyrimidine glycosylase/DNA-(apurinic or apyrimidinic site) lyase [Spiribacter halobius]
MPELPEVETTRRGVAPHAVGRRLAALVVREPRLRWPVDAGLAAQAQGRRVTALERRAKYLLFGLEGGLWLLLHLGMSGSLRVVPAGAPPQRHDHLDLALDSGEAVRFTDPRRFGSLHGASGDPEAHPLLRHLGPEPLGEAFHGQHLYALSRSRRVPVKAFVMDSRVVVGVGNIYAAEALWRARIHPGRAAGRIGLGRYRRLAEAIKAVLAEAIEAGGTTLRDFTRGDGTPGYFRQQLDAYGRAGLPCRRCGTPLQSRRLAQRATVYCPRCQR